MRVLIPIDAHDRAEELLEAARPWVMGLGAEIDLLFVNELVDSAVFVHDPVLRGHVQAEWDAALERDRDALQALMASLPEARRGVVRVEHGKAAAVISRLSGDYDAVIIGTHGRTGLTRAWLGSVAERVVRLASVPVLVLHVA